MKGQQRKLVTLASSNSLKDMDSQQVDKDLLRATISSSTPKPPVRVAVGGKGNEGGGALEWMEGWGEDMVDVGLHGLELESRGDISQLQSDLVRLQVECQHWKELAQQRINAQVCVCVGLCMYVCVFCMYMYMYLPCCIFSIKHQTLLHAIPHMPIVSTPFH